MPKTFTRAQLARRKLPRLIQDVEALGAGHDTTGLDKEALLDILEEAEQAEVNEDETEEDQQESAKPRRGRAAAAASSPPPKRVSGRTRKATSPLPPPVASTSRRGRKAPPVPEPESESEPAPARKPRATSKAASSLSKAKGKGKAKAVDPPEPIRESTSEQDAATVVSVLAPLTEEIDEIEDDGAEAELPVAPPPKRPVGRAPRTTTKPTATTTTTTAAVTPGVSAAEFNALQASLARFEQLATDMATWRSKTDAALIQLSMAPTPLPPLPSPPPPSQPAPTPAFTHTDADFTALVGKLAEKENEINALRAEIKEMNESYRIVKDLDSSIQKSVFSFDRIQSNSVVKDIQLIKTSQDDIQGKLERVDGRFRRFDELRLSDVRDDVILHGKELHKIDKALEVLHNRLTDLESKSSKVVAYAAGRLPPELSSSSSGDTSSGVATGSKRKRGADDQSSPQPTKIILKAGLGRDTHQIVEQRADGFTVTTRTGVMPLAAAYSRDTGF